MENIPQSNQHPLFQPVLQQQTVVQQQPVIQPIVTPQQQIQQLEPQQLIEQATIQQPKEQQSELCYDLKEIKQLVKEILSELKEQIDSKQKKNKIEKPESSNGIIEKKKRGRPRKIPLETNQEEKKEVKVITTKVDRESIQSRVKKQNEKKTSNESTKNNRTRRSRR